MKKVVIIHESQIPESHPTNHMGVSLPESGWLAIHFTNQDELAELWDLTHVMLQYSAVEDVVEGELITRNEFDPDASVMRIAQAFVTVQGGGDPAIVVCTINQFRQMLNAASYKTMYPSSGVDT